MRQFTTIALLALSILSWGQAAPTPPANSGGVAPPSAADIAAQKAENAAHEESLRKLRKATDQAEKTGTSARLKEIAHFRGIRSNRLEGIGLVVGLDATGDSKKMGPTYLAFQNYLKRLGFDVDARTLEPKNIALVAVSAELPPGATNGQAIDVTISTFGDAKSLRNGTLLYTELMAPASRTELRYASASGQVSVGGFAVGGGGNTQTKGFTTVGRIPGGGIVEQSAPTTIVKGGKIDIELNEYDLTTAQRMESKIREELPQFQPVALDGGTVQVSLPEGLSQTKALSLLEALTIFTDSEAKVIINERTGTIVMGGNVRLAPAVIATASLSVKIESEPFVSQPAPFSQGQTVVGSAQTLTVDDSKAQIAVVPPNTTVSDLAQIFQILKLKPSDIINILQLLHQQGALKAKVIIQ